MAGTTDPQTALGELQDVRLQVKSQLDTHVAAVSAANAAVADFQAKIKAQQDTAASEQAHADRVKRILDELDQALADLSGEDVPSPPPSSGPAPSGSAAPGASTPTAPASPQPPTSPLPSPDQSGATSPPPPPASPPATPAPGGTPSGVTTSPSSGPTFSIAPGGGTSQP